LILPICRDGATFPSVWFYLDRGQKIDSPALQTRSGRCEIFSGRASAPAVQKVSRRLQLRSCAWYRQRPGLAAILLIPKKGWALFPGRLPPSRCRKFPSSPTCFGHLPSVD